MSCCCPFSNKCYQSVLLSLLKLYRSWRSFALFCQEGQESSIAYSKCKADIETMGLDMEALLEKVNSAPNTEGLGGIPGLFGE